MPLLSDSEHRGSEFDDVRVHNRRLERKEIKYFLIHKNLVKLNVTKTNSEYMVKQRVSLFKAESATDQKKISANIFVISTYLLAFNSTISTRLKHVTE